MSFRIFHYGNEADEHYFLTGRFDGWTGRLKCRWWEWSGWYNGDLYQRLLGHYLLFQHFKKDDRVMKRSIDVAHAYILQYRSTQGIKYFLSGISSMAWSFLTLGRSFPQVEIESLNRMLVNEGAGILSEFLTGSDLNFRQAMRSAAEKIQSSSFISMAAKGFSPAYLLQINQQVNNQFNTHHNESFTEIYHPLPAKEGATGKEKGVLSGRQWLILFDILSTSTGKLKKLETSTHAKVEKAASLLHALSGKDKPNLIKQMNYYNNHGGLYKTNGPGELQQLIIIVINMSNIFRDNNQPYLAELIDKKIVELETEKTRSYPGE